MKGPGAYLYRAIDRDDNLVDVLLSERQDQVAAEAFFHSARTVTEVVPTGLRLLAMAHTPAPSKRNWGKP